MTLYGVFMGSTKFSTCNNWTSRVVCSYAESKHRLSLFIVLISFLLGGCANAQSQSVMSESKRPPFRKTTVHIGKQKTYLEVAESSEQLAYGLMFVKSLDEHAGMLFVFDSEQPLAFWMKNTFIPLDVGYFDKNRKLVDVQTMKPAPYEVSPRNYPSARPAQYAIEMKAGWYKKYKIKVGDKFSF